jgi:tetratricopeptide (TPR) repeat protein
LSAAKKCLFSLLVTITFFAALELVLAGVGVKPILYDKDPYVGFASYIPLFVREDSSDGPAYMVTAPNKRKWFNSQRFLAQKPAGAYRIFCMGGSTTYGHPYDDTTSFCGWLREFLRAADPSREWEVVNAGGISYASYRVARLMEELVRYEPDLFIIYSGHNEFLERRTYASLIRLPSAVRGIGGLLSRTRLFTAVQYLVHSTEAKKSAETAPRDQLPGEVFTQLEHGVGPDAYERDDAMRQQILDHYRFNLLRMVDIARSVGADVILVTPASNLGSCSPFKSEHREGLDESQLRRWQMLVDRAVEARAAKRLDEAIGHLDEARSIDDRYAELYYLRGRVLEDLGRHAEAKVAFLRALDEDICPLRALAPMRQIVADVATDRNVAMVDFVSLVEQQSEHGIPDQRLFLDHVHPTLEGNRLLARALLQELIRQDVATPASSWGEQALQQVVQRVESQLDQQAHGMALTNLAKVLAWAGKVEESNELALRAARMGTADADTHYQAGNALTHQGDLAGAADQYKRALGMNPRYLEAHNALGVVYQRLGQLDQAVAQYKLVIRLKPDFAPGHSNLGAVLDQQGHLDEAIFHFEEAIRINPRYSKAHNNLGVLLRGQRKLDEAAIHFQRALQINPEFAEAHYNLGHVRAMQGNHKEAIVHYEQAVRIKPDYAPARRQMERYRAGK